MALTHLVDTSVLTRLSVPAVRQRVATLDAAAAVSAMTDLELGHSARNSSEWDDIIDSLEVFGRIDVEPHHFRRAGQVQRRLAEAGLRGRKVPDLLIAAGADDLGLTVLHYDRDFDHIAAITGQRCEWVVDPGSID